MCVAWVVLLFNRSKREGRERESQTDRQTDSEANKVRECKRDKDREANKKATDRKERNKKRQRQWIIGREREGGGEIDRESERE